MKDSHLKNPEETCHHVKLKAVVSLQNFQFHLRYSEVQRKKEIKTTVTYA